MVPKGWKLTTLGQVCDGNLQTGPFGSQLHAHEYVDTGIPVLMPKDLVNCRANLSNAAKITSLRAKDLTKHLLKSGDLLFSRRGDVTRFALIDKDSEGSICGTGCLKARPSNKHSSSFLAYFLQKDSVKKWLEQNAVGQTMPNMNTEILNELPLMSASSKEEEEKIAQILSTWDQAISATEKLLENSQQQKKALMQQLLTGKKRLLDESGVTFSEEWQLGHLVDIAKISKGKALSSKDLEIGNYPVIAGGKTSPYTHSEYTHENVITVSASGAYAGYVAFYPYKIWASDCSVVSNKIGSDVNFIYHLLVSMQTIIYSRQSGGAQPHIYPKDIEGLKILIPPLVEQKKIASVISLAAQEIRTLQKKIDCLKQEKKALMQQLLTGKKRVKVAA